MELRPIDRNQPVVDQGFKPLQNLQIFCTQVRNSIIDIYARIGSGGSFTLDDGTASASGAFMFDDGGA